MTRTFLLCLLLTGCATATPAPPPEDCNQVYRQYQIQQTITNICNRTARCTLTYDNIATEAATQVALFDCYKEHKLDTVN